MLGGTVTGSALNFGVQLLLARVLGVEQFGAFASALAMVTLVAPLAGFGLGGYWLNVYGREGWSGQRWLPASIRFLLISTTLVIGGILAWAWLGPHDALTASMLLILAVFVVGQAAIELASAKYQLEGRHFRLAMWQLLPHLLRFTVMAALVFFIGVEMFTATHAAIVFASVALILVVLGGYQVWRLVLGNVHLEGHSYQSGIAPEGGYQPRIRQVLSGAWPFGLAGIFYLIYFQSDIILIKYLIGDVAAGIYNVAFIIMAAVYLFPSVLYQKFLLPKLHRWAYHDPLKLTVVYRVGNFTMLALGIVAMFMLWLLAPYFVPLLFGNEYAAAGTLLMILAVAAPFRFLASSAGALLNTRDYMRIKVRLMGVAALTNVILNLVLIPAYGATGAAVATVLSDVLLCILYIIISRRLIFLV